MDFRHSKEPLGRSFLKALKNDSFPVDLRVRVARVWADDLTDLPIDFAESVLFDALASITDPVLLHETLVAGLWHLHKHSWESKEQVITDFKRVLDQSASYPEESQCEILKFLVRTRYNFKEDLHNLANTNLDPAKRRPEKVEALAALFHAERCLKDPTTDPKHTIYLNQLYQRLSSPTAKAHAILASIYYAGPEIGIVHFEREFRALADGKRDRGETRSALVSLVLGLETIMKEFPSLWGPAEETFRSNLATSIAKIAKDSSLQPVIDILKCHAEGDRRFLELLPNESS